MVVTKLDLHEKVSDRPYWLTKTPEERIEALEQIRTEFNNWRYGVQPRLQRVYTIIERQ
jgi:hypothetical protein